MMKYAIELSAFGVQFKPQDTYKAQILADLLAAFIGEEDPIPYSEKSK